MMHYRRATGAIMDKNATIPTETETTSGESLDISIDSAAIRRMVEEVRSESKLGVSRSYNRTFNRHNR
jgi:hypothetical protein